ncbi:MAG TPA: type II toxin-antitoxin system PemK/MazF family toxin [Devosia sp.]|nr:type II toxin-antitoxin system PemK/MazF family toxin [Devosia sp.]
MPTFSQGNVVRVPFPYTRDVQPRRPALVISGGALGDGLLMWVLMITSAGNRPWPGDVDLSGELETTGLPAPSVVRTAKIATIETSIALPLGRVSEQTMERVRSAMFDWVGELTSAERRNG